MLQNKLSDFGLFCTQSRIMIMKKTIKTTAIGLTSLLLAMTAQANTIDTIGLDAEELPACASTKLPAGVEFTEIFPECGYAENLAPVVQNGKYGFVDKAGKIAIAPSYQEAHSFGDGLALVKQNGKFGFIDKTGKMVIAPTYQDAWSFWEGRAKVAQNGKFGFIDKTGKMVIAPTYAATGNWFEDGLVVVKSGNKFGFIDKNGKTIIKPQFDLAKDFSEGLALVGNKTGKTDANKEPLYKYGFIDKTGKVVIKIQYDLASDFVKGAAFVIEGGQVYYIDKNGKPTQMPDYN